MRSLKAACSFSVLALLNFHLAMAASFSAEIEDRSAVVALRDVSTFVLPSIKKGMFEFHTLSARVQHLGTC